MTEAPGSNAISPVVFMGSGGPDLTPEAVERFAQILEIDAKNQSTMPSALTGLMPDCECEIAATLRALSAKLKEAVDVMRMVGDIIHNGDDPDGSGFFDITAAEIEQVFAFLASIGDKP